MIKLLKDVVEAWLVEQKQPVREWGEYRAPLGVFEAIDERLKLKEKRLIFYVSLYQRWIIG